MTTDQLLHARKFISMSFIGLILVFNNQAIAQDFRSIFIIESYHLGYDWDKSYINGLKEALGSHYQLSRFEMDTKRLPKHRFKQQAEKAWQTYQSLQPDLVVLADDNALNYMAPYFVDTNIPVVYLGINNNPREYGLHNQQNFTGILERPLLKRSTQFIKDIVPGSKKLLILFDSGTTSTVIKEEAFKNQNRIHISGLDIELRTLSRQSQWRQQILSSKDNGYDAIILGLYQTLADEQGNNVSDAQVIKWTSENSPLPLFAFWSFTVGENKAIGGFVLDGKDQGKEAGNIIKSIFSGTPPYTILPITGASGNFIFSTSQLQRWNLILPEYIAHQATFLP